MFFLALQLSMTLASKKQVSIISCCPPFSWTSQNVQIHCCDYLGFLGIGCSR